MAPVLGRVKDPGQEHLLFLYTLKVAQNLFSNCLILKLTGGNSGEKVWMAIHGAPQCVRYV